MSKTFEPMVFDEADRCHRPMLSPNKIAWKYYEVPGAPPGTLAEATFKKCACGCGHWTRSEGGQVT